MSIPTRLGYYKIGPQKAAEFLKVNHPHNRRISEGRVLRYMNEMKEGRWLDRMPGAIAVDEDGYMVEGQHRMWSLIKTGMTFEFLVIVDVPKKGFKVMGTGKPRTAADILSMSGKKNCSLLASMLGHQFTYETGSRSSENKTPSLIEEMSRKYPDTEDSVTYIVEYSKDLAGIYPGGALAFIHYNARKARTNKADEFVHGFSTGEGLSRGDPRLALRNKMIKIRRDPTTKMGSFAAVHMGIKVWNAFAKGTPISKMYYIRADTAGRVFWPRFVK